MSKKSSTKRERQKIPMEASEKTWNLYSNSTEEKKSTRNIVKKDKLEFSSEAHQIDSFKTLRGSGRDISWNNLTVSIVKKSKGYACCKKQPKGPTERVVLHKVYGTATSGQMVAIMGSSGAGKSTLLNVFTNIDQRGIRKHPESQILVNGELITPDQMRSISAYVQQFDMFLGALTVEEQLRYSASLRMDPKQFPAKLRDERIKQLLNQMNLEKCRDTRIGVKGVVKGISVGEKKRLSFACELLTNPDFFFCDEPTSGLDAFMATQVANALNKMAKKERKTVITTIHQPSDDVFQLFDKVCFLSREEGVGRVAFFGSPSELNEFLKNIASPYNEHKRLHGIQKANVEASDEENELLCPIKSGLAEHAMRIISRTVSDNQESFEDRVRFIREQYEDSRIGVKQQNRAKNSGEHTAPSYNQDLKSKRSYPVNWFVQTGVLFSRSIKTIIRDPILLQVRLVQILLTATIIGIINWQTPFTGPTATNLEGVLYNSPRDMNLFLFPSIYALTAEFPLIAREYRAGFYSPSAYFVGKSLAELPQYTLFATIYSTIIYWTVGFQQKAIKYAIFCFFNMLELWIAVSVGYAAAAIFGTESLAQTFMPCFVLPMLLFGGFYVDFDSIPIYYKFISYGSWFRYGFEGLSINQWGDIGDVPGCKATNTSDYRDKYVPVASGEDFCPAVDGVGLLERRGMDESNLLRAGLVLLSVFVLARTVGLLAFVLRVKLAR
ncbi:ABC transporter ATP-binding protein/permease wht-1 [Aphelenchoides besseyi]|nr:ABC transporter ATP-binding protein/permease wht-1 [Aphelenchoides besseyi]KAI6217192.1 ABC transporter ATP-binding protein/permease wht-1 [Aphelenchoides besseyi]